MLYFSKFIDLTSKGQFYNFQIYKCRNVACYVIQTQSATTVFCCSFLLILCHQTIQMNENVRLLLIPFSSGRSDMNFNIAQIFRDSFWWFCVGDFGDYLKRDMNKSRIRNSRFTALYLEKKSDITGSSHWLAFRRCLWSTFYVRSLQCHIWKICEKKSEFTSSEFNWSNWALSTECWVFFDSM